MFFKRSAPDAGAKKPGLFARLKSALGATKDNLVARIETVLSTHPAIDDALLEELEGVLLGADLGVKATSRIMDEIQTLRKKEAVKTPDDVRAAIRRQLLAMLDTGRDATPSAAPEGHQVWMVVGVNGTGKTTTVGKLAARLSQEGNRILI